MSESESQPEVRERAAVFACGGVFYTEKDVIDAALTRGELEPIWRDLLRSIDCENAADEAEIKEGALDEAAEAFRYDHDLITAEETEHWLEVRGFNLEDFGSYFARRYWGQNWKEEVEPEAIDYVSASEELRELLRTDLMLSGEFDRMSSRLSWRVAANTATKDEEVDAGLLADQEKIFLERLGIDQGRLEEWLAGLGRDRAWLNQILRMEVAARLKREQLLTAQARRSEAATLRLPLTQFEVELIELESSDAAREASLCVTEDGLSMEEVAKEGRYPFRRVSLLLQDIEVDLQQKFLSVSPGKVLEPIERGDGFHLCRIISKVEPNAEDPALKEIIDRSIIERHFSQLVANHIQWQGPLNYTQ
ncbi:MAG: hypothetical protein ABI925_09315 [Verrucomicrobiota bacterium]